MKNKLKEFNNYNGFLFIGDPHLWSLKPGSRIDHSFMDTVLDKLDQSFNIAIKNNLYPVILGDLFQDDKDFNALMLNKIINLLKKLPEPPVTIIGNHEKIETTLTDNTYIACLRDAGLLYTIEKNQFWGKFVFKNQIIYIGGTPYGQKIPGDIEIYANDKIDLNNKTIWLTHHDLGIGISYPGCIIPHEIKNCFMVVNGHDHTTKPPIKVGSTTYYNPGNITRMSINAANHKPSVWHYNPETDDFIQIELNYKKHVFNLAKKEIEPDIDKKEHTNINNQLSNFTKLLQEEVNSNNEHNLTDDSSFMLKNIEALGQALSLDAQFIQELKELAMEANTN